MANHVPSYFVTRWVYRVRTNAPAALPAREDHTAISCEVTPQGDLLFLDQGIIKAYARGSWFEVKRVGEADPKEKRKS